MHAVVAVALSTGNEDKRKKAGNACAVPAFSQRCRETPSRIRPQISGRGERIRTSDSCVPNAVLYQAELRPESGHGLVHLPRLTATDFVALSATKSTFRFVNFNLREFQPCSKQRLQCCFSASDLDSPRKRRILTENLEKGKRDRQKVLRGPDPPRPRRPGGRVPARPSPGWRRPRRQSRRRPS